LYFWADLNKGTTIGSSLLRKQHPVRHIRLHLETNFNKHQPVDIQSIMDKFVLDVDKAQPLEKYFERQQQCQLILVETSEPIRDASMKWTAVGHFLKIPHQVRWVREYESDVDPTGTGSWEDLWPYFIEKQMEHINDQATLATVDIANSAEVDEELNGMKCEIENMAEKTQQLEEALIAMVAFMAEAKQPPPTPAPTPSPVPFSMEQQFAAFVAAQQQQEAPKEQSAIDKAVTRALRELTNNSGAKKNASPANAVFSTATLMDVTSPTTAPSERKWRPDTVMQQLSVIG
jgi:hypothetical protein